MTVQTPITALPADIQAVLAKLEPAVYRAFLAAIARIRSQVRIGDLVAAIRAGNVQAAMDTLRLDRTQFGALDRAISEAQYQGAIMAETQLQRLRLVPQPFGTVGAFGYDARHPRAEELARTQAGNLIQGIIDDQKDAIRKALTAGIQSGTGPMEVARDIVGRINRATGQRTGGIVGLTSQMTDWVISAEDELASTDPAKLRNYLTRERRDGRFDRAVKTAIQTGKPVPREIATKALMHYKNGLLQLRGERISRTEAITGLRAGRHEGYQQLVDSGKIRADQVIKTWRAVSDGRTRHDHQILNGETVKGLGALFVSPHGAMEYPGDSSHGADPAAFVNCRCFMSYQIDRRGTF